MIYEHIQYIIPYVSKDFITFPLTEEGNYTPFINFWQIFNAKKKKKEFEKRLNALLKPYDFKLEEKYTWGKIVEYHIYPAFITKRYGVYIYKQEWMMEDIITILGKFLKDILREKTNELEGN